MKNVHYMDRLELETELIERRMQVENLIHEIERKNEYIKIYSDYLNKLMEEGRGKSNGKNWEEKNNTRILRKND